MTFEEIVAILKDNTRTEYQRAADIHAALTKASQPSALNIKPDKPRKKREPRTVVHATRFNTATGEMEEIKHEQ